MKPDETTSPVEAGVEADAKASAPIKPSPASKSTSKAKSSAPKPKKDAGFGEIRINDNMTVRYDKAGSKSMNLPKPRETQKTVG